jgi:hypothetical protein
MVFMNITLTDIPVTYINLDKYPNRNQSMINMLEHLGFTYKRIDGVTGRPYDSIIDAQINALNSGSVPCIVLEDDCIPYSFVNEIEVPDDADIVYLGNHGAGMSEPRYTEVSPGIWRVHNMLALHAVLYITQHGKDVFLSALEEAKIIPEPADVATANAQHKAKVYALDVATWYQYDYPELTKESLSYFVNNRSGIYGGGCPDYEAPITFGE